VADSTYATLPLLARCQHRANPITFITRVRLDAALYEPAPPRDAHQIGRPRRKGKRLPSLARVVEVASATAVWYQAGQPTVPLRWVLIRDPQHTFETQALLCTDPQATPDQILAWFVQRWQLEVTFEEARRHLGLEPQRQWSDLAIARTPPALLGLFSLVTLLADQRLSRSSVVIPLPTWSRKDPLSCADALALVRRELWTAQSFCLSSATTDTMKVPRVLIEHLTNTLCYAA
jgi:hypothetical protein